MAAEISRTSTAEDRLSLYQKLAEAGPENRTALILRLVEEHPEGRLDLPAVGGLRVTLDGIDLSRGRVPQANSTPCWWDAQRHGVSLPHANLHGASLRGANLQGVFLEESDLADADLAGAELRGVDLSGTVLDGALLEGADLRKAVLRFIRGSGCILEDARLQGADLWGADLERADLSGADCQGTTLEEANLASADLSGVDFRGAILKRANLKGANLTGADLRGAVFGGTNLEDAVLRDAKFEDVDLTGCTLRHVHLCGTRLEKTRLEQEQLGGAIGEEVAEDYGQARKGYLVLERNFEEVGDHDAARWAYRRRRRMEKRQALAMARTAGAERRWTAAAQACLKYSGDLLVEYICDYGESVWRVLGTLIMVYVLFTGIYGLTGTVLRVEETPTGKVMTPTYNLVDLALYSLTAMTAPGNPPDYLTALNAYTYVLAGVQTLLSIFLTGLMGFVAGNRIRR